MNSILWQYFSDHPEFQIIDKSNSALEFEPGNGFEELYLKLRAKEGRLYPDEIVKLLPEISSTHILNKEWRIRESSAKKIAGYLKAQEIVNPVVLDIGCGNGWLTNYLSTRFPAIYCGVDVNKTELEKQNNQKTKIFTFSQLACSTEFSPRNMIRPSETVFTIITILSEHSSSETVQDRICADLTGVARTFGKSGSDFDQYRRHDQGFIHM